MALTATIQVIVRAAPVPADLASLGSTYGVLRTTPAYPQVKEAIHRLEAAEPDGTEYAEKSKDIGIVREFAEMVQSSQEHVARTLIAAATVGRIANAPTAGEGIAIGLTVLRERFAESLDARSVGQSARRRILDGARAVWELDPSSLPNVEAATKRSGWPKTLRRFEAILGDALSELRTALATTVAVVDRAKRQALGSMGDRIAKYLSSDVPLDQSGLAYPAELIAAAVGALSPMARPNLATMSVADWSALFASSFEDNSRLLAGALSAIALGFVDRQAHPFSGVFQIDVVSAGSEVFERIERTQTAFRSRLDSRPKASPGQPPCAVVLIGARDGSLPPLSPEPMATPAVAFSRDKVERALQRELRLLGTLPREARVVIAVEVEPPAINSMRPQPVIDESELTKIRAAAAAVRSGGLPDVVYVYAFQTDAPRPLPAVVLPKTLQEVVSSAIGLTAQK